MRHSGAMEASWGDAELIGRIEGGESDRVEFTASTTDLDKFREALCAFANDLPGNGLEAAFSDERIGTYLRPPGETGSRRCGSTRGRQRH